MHSNILLLYSKNKKIIERIQNKKNKKRKEINFPGYTYKKEVEEQKSKLGIVSALIML